MFKINFVGRKAERDIQTALAHTESHAGLECEDVAVRKQIYLTRDPIYLYEEIGKFLRDCQYDEDCGYDIKDGVMYLYGSRPLTASEADSFKKGLFE